MRQVKAELTAIVSQLSYGNFKLRHRASHDRGFLLPSRSRPSDSNHHICNLHNYTLPYTAYFSKPSMALQHPGPSSKQADPSANDLLRYVTTSCVKCWIRDIFALEHRKSS